MVNASIKTSDFDPRLYNQASAEIAEPKGVGQGLAFSNRPALVLSAVVEPLDPAASMHPFPKAVASLDWLCPPLNDGDGAVTIAEALFKLREMRLDCSNGTVRMAMEGQRAAAALQWEQSELAAEASKDDDSGLWRAIAAVLVAAVGLCLSIVTGGSSLALAAAIISMCLAADNLLVERAGHGAMGLTLKAFGASDETATTWDGRIHTAAAAAALICGVCALTGVGANSVSQAGTAADAASHAGTAADTASQAGNTASTASTATEASNAAKFAQGVERGTKFVSGGTQLYDAYRYYQNGQLAAEAKQAEAKAMEASIIEEFCRKMAEAAIRTASEAVTTFAENIGHLSEVYADAGDATARMARNIARA